MVIIYSWPSDRKEHAKTTNNKHFCMHILKSWSYDKQQQVKTANYTKLSMHILKSWPINNSKLQTTYFFHAYPYILAKKPV